MRRRMPLAATTLAVAVALALVLAGGGVYVARKAGSSAPPATANLWVLNGAPGRTCDATPAREATPVTWQAAPLHARACTLRQAYDAARSGDTVRVRAGVYPVQAFAGGRDPATGNDTPVGAADVTFVGEPTTTIRRLIVGGSGITLDGFDIVGAGKDVALDMGTAGGTLRNSRVGHVVDNKGAIMGAPDQTIDHVDFHDVTYSGVGDVHGECLFITAPTTSSCATRRSRTAS